MNVQQPVNAVFLVGLVVFFAIRHIFINRTKVEQKTVLRTDKLDRVLLVAMFLTTLLLPLAYLFTPWLAFADYVRPAAVGWLGAVLMVASLWLFWRAHTDLGQNWSVNVELRDKHELVTHGVYRRVRHPMYASIWLWCIAQAVMLANFVAGALILPIFAVMYFTRAPREERLLCDAFGEEYRQYMQSTGRVFPRFQIAGRRRGPS